MFGDIILRILSDPWALLLVVLFFGASIFVHELGHFLAARWRGLKIERFSIGFGPRLFGWKDRHGVDWRVSLLPLGGYVALPQLADMRGIEGDSKFSKDQLPPISYADKMYVSVAGAAFNVLFALALGTVLWITGIHAPEEQQSTTVGYIYEEMTGEGGDTVAGPALAAGLQVGDRIVEVDGKNVSDWEDLTYAITTGVGRTDAGDPQTVLTVERDGRTLDLTVKPGLDPFEGMRRIGILPAQTLLVGEVMDNSPAEDAGLQSGDIIVSMDGERIQRREALSYRLMDTGTEPVTITYLRGGEETEATLVPEEVTINTDGDTMPMLGVRWEPVTYLQHVNPISQIYRSIETTFRVLGALLHPKSDVGLNNLSGPVGISYTLYIISQIGILEVISIVILININLAILNLLPIPVLDGGHMVFATIGRLRGKPLPANFVASAQGVFMLLFLALFFYVTFFDVGRVERNESAIIEAERAAAKRVPIEFKDESALPAQDANPASESAGQTPEP